MPTLYSYIVAQDSGFAPNPFFGWLTLACCKPAIRRTATVGDYVIGLSPRRKGNRVVFAMRVSEKLTLHNYWLDERFRNKRPDGAMSGERAFGDNIYRWEGECWMQSPSLNHVECHKATDTSGKFVLASKECDFVYWGGDGPSEKLGLPLVGRGHRSVSNQPHLPAFKDWFAQQPCGKLRDPALPPPPRCRPC